MDWSWVAPLVSLTVLEIVLGIDNIVFLAVIVAKLPQEQRAVARMLGLSAALVLRILLLLSLKWMMQAGTPLFSLETLGPLAHWFSDETLEFSSRDLIEIGGGLFLVAKATFEIHDKLEGESDKPLTRGKGSFGWVLLQIALLDLVFSIDSVITAVGMAREIWIMIVAVVISIGVMILFAGPVGRFVERHPTIKMLALSFLILIGVMLIADGLGQHIPRGYIYFAMGFSVAVELLNLKLRGKGTAVVLNEPHTAADA